MFNLTLNNYRCFIDQELKFAKYNILIGENSAGKSSVLKFFLMLKQTIANATENLLLYKPNFCEIDLGNYKDIVYYHEENRNISFSFEFDTEDYKQYFFDFLTTKYKDDDKLRIQNYLTSILNFPKGYIKTTFEITKDLHLEHELLIKFYHEDFGVVNVKPTQPSPSDIDILKEVSFCDIKFEKYINNRIVEFKNINYKKEGFLTLIQGDSLYDACKKEDPENANVLYHEIAWFLITQNYISNKINKINYSNPLESAPQRFYYGRQPIGARGQGNLNFEELMYVINRAEFPEKYRKRFLDKVIEIFSKYGLSDSVTIEYSGARNFEIRIENKGLSSNITDVGSGSFLLLSILVRMLLSEEKIMLIEQPETHLHPKLQADFIEMLIEFGTAEAYFIETHSEYMIRKLQVLVKEHFKGISKDDITINYFSRDDKKFNITSHNIDKDGRIEPIFPSGFFDKSYLITRELIK